MPATDLVRASRDGDQFHYLWASRRALLLIAKETQLKQITIEGVAKFELDNKFVEEGEHIPHCQNSCHPYLNNLNGGKGDNHGTIQCRTQTSNIKQTAIA